MLEISDLQLGFLQNRRLLRAVDGVSITINPGETLALLGESGCGKSATAQGIMRLLPPAGRILGGSVRLHGTDLLSLSESVMRRVRGKKIAMIFQEPAACLNPVLTIETQIQEVLFHHTTLRGQAIFGRMISLLDQVGIADAKRRLREYPFQLSGGMKQRVMIAIALAAEPDFLIADEPTTALDVTVQAQILDLLKALQKARGMGILLITHDLGVVAQMADTVGVMYAGNIVEMADRETFFSSPTHPYTRALFAALPDNARRDTRLQALSGQVPMLDQLPVGCRFAPRCHLAFPMCHEAFPPWQITDNKEKNHRFRCHFKAPIASKPLFAHDLSEKARLSIAPCLEVHDLKVHFPIQKGLLRRTVGQVKAVDGISLALYPGRVLALVGESGSGKTTAGKAILQLLHASGSITLHGKPVNGLKGRHLRHFRRHIQMVFQDPFSSLNPRFTVGEILAEGMSALLKNVPTDNAVMALLTQVGLPPDAIHRYPHEFSGGQRQRIAIARALAVQPEIMVCDEPTSALDLSVQAQILNLLKQLQADLGVAYLFITHNFGVVAYLAHDIAVMYLGRIVESGTAEDVLNTPRHPYTLALLSAVPAPSLENTKKIIRLEGDPPSPENPPAGCHFHPRCPAVLPICREKAPQNVDISTTHKVCCHLF